MIVDIESARRRNGWEFITLLYSSTSGLANALDIIALSDTNGEEVMDWDDAKI